MAAVDSSHDTALRHFAQGLDDDAQNENAFLQVFENFLRRTVVLTKLRSALYRGFQPLVHLRLEFVFEHGTYVVKADLHALEINCRNSLTQVGASPV